LLNMEKTELLAKVPLFASLKSTYLSEIASKVTVRNYRRGEAIFHKDDPGYALYIIRKGQVKIHTSSPDGEEVILTILKDGDFFGELSLLDGRPRSATATALDNIEVLMLHRDDLLDIVGRHAELAVDIMIALSERLRRTNLLLEDSIFLDLPRRLCRRLLELGEKHGFEMDKGIEIDLNLTQQDLAEIVGASRVAVNRLLGLFQDMGLVSISKKHIIILRPEELRKRIY